MKIDNIDHVTVVYKDGHSDVFYRGHIKGQKVDTEPTGSPAGKGIPVSYITLILTPRKEQDASQGAEAAQ